MDPVAEELASWREEAAVLRRHGHDRDADRLERLAERIEDAERRRGLQEVSISEAAELSGYTEKALRRMVREERLPDQRPTGSQGEIRIPRWSLPRKPRSGRNPFEARAAGA